MATDFTPHYNLDKYVATDKPNLRDQYNAAMDKIDLALLSANTNATEAKAVTQDYSGRIDAALAEAQQANESVSDLSDEVDSKVAELNSDLSSETSARESADQSLSSSIASVASTVSGLSDTVSGMGVKIPTSDFTAQHTVKNYIDERDSAVGAAFPLTAFSSSNTVKDYVDGKDSALRALLPASSFSSTNTVKKYIDDNVAQAGGMLNLKNKKIVCIGDSLTYSPSAHASTYWPEYLHTLYGATTYRFAHGGTGFVATTTTSTKTFIQDVEDAHNSTEFNDNDITDVIIIGGLNDYSVADNTLRGAISTCIGNAQSYFRNARIHIGFNLKGTDPLGDIHENSVRQLRQMYYAANLRGACVIENPWTWGMRSGFDAGDGIHVNADGQRNFAGRIASHLCGGSALDTFMGDLAFTSEFSALLTGSSNIAYGISDGYTVNIYARGQFNANATMPSGNVTMINLWSEFRSGLVTSSGQLLTPLNCDTAMVVSGSYIAFPRAYYNGGNTINAQFLHRMDLSHGSGVFGIHMSWPCGL